MTEYEALATAAVKALEAASTPTWTDIFGAIGAIGVGLLQAGLICTAFNSMADTAKLRDKQLDQQAEASKRQGKLLAAIGAGIREVLVRMSPDKQQNETP